MNMNMKDIILGEQDRQQYDDYMNRIVECYNRMATNRNTTYRQKLMKLADATLERMTVLLEQAQSQEGQR